MNSRIPGHLSSKNLKRYAHTQTFNRISGKRTVSGRYRTGQGRFHWLSGKALGVVLGLLLLAFFLTGFGFILF